MGGLLISQLPQFSGTLQGDDLTVIHDTHETVSYKTKSITLNQVAAFAAANITSLNISQVVNLQTTLDGKQPLNAELTTLAGLASTGNLVRTGSATYSLRAMTGTANEITVTNGDGVAGNPTFSLPASLTFTGKTVTGGTFNSPAFVTPALGTPASGVATNLTGTAAGLTAGNVTTNANLTGDVTSVGNATTLTNAPVIAKVLTGYVSGAGTITAADSILTAIQKLNGNNATNANLTGVITSVGNATSIASQTGTGTKFVVDTNPVLIGPTLGAATATSINGNTFTTGTYTLTGTAGKTFTFSNTLTLAGTDGTTMTFPTTSATLARTDAANTFTGHQTIEGVTSTGATGSGKFVFDTNAVLVTPNLGTPSAAVLTNASGTAASLTAGNVTTNANLTGQVTSVGNAATVAPAAITAQTLNNSPVAANDYVMFYSASNTALQKATISSLISSGTAGVSTFNSRSGAVVPVSGDYDGIAFGQTGLLVKGATSFGLTIKPNETLTAARTLNYISGDASRTITLGGDITTAGALNTSGAFALTLTTTASTNVTLPTTGTLPALGGTNTWSGVQSFNDGNLGLKGSSSGTMTLKAPAAASSFVATFPAATCNIGYLEIPQNSQGTAYTTVLADSGKHILHPSADTTARTFTIDSNANVAYPVGTAITFVNQNSAGVMTIAITTDTMRLAGTGTTGSRTLAANGIATALKLTSTEWIISGTGLT